ncbi:hypothetical protein PFLmoz3_05070 [Pseudomonas fluorescens]|uniref:Uncharacterized protein n=1 Tax=Pseudomonas fluorescens TaxID=294 RepID=A0A109LD06_PSEFL|nr:hypothetical protein PFLmoz3_05070 [Pseudomonas fluorescens]
MLAIGLGHFGQPMLGQDQLARRGIVAVDAEHALFNDVGQVAPMLERFMLDGRLDGGAKGCVNVSGQRLKQRRHTGEKVVHR